MCAHRLWNEATGLCCDLTEGHAGSHTYHATWAPDAHDTSEESACSAA